MRQFTMPYRVRKLLSYVIDQFHQPEPPDIYTVPWEALPYLGAPLPLPMPYSSFVEPEFPPLVLSYEQHVWGGAQLLGGQTLNQYTTPHPSGSYASGEAGLFVKQMPSTSLAGTQLELAGGLTYFDVGLGEDVSFSDPWTLPVEAPPFSIENETVAVQWAQWSPTNVIPLYDEQGQPMFSGVSYQADATELYATDYSEPVERVSYGVSPGGVEKIYNPRWVPDSPSTYLPFSVENGDGTAQYTGLLTKDGIPEGTYVYRYVGPYLIMEFENAVRMGETEPAPGGDLLTLFAEPEFVDIRGNHFAASIFSTVAPFRLTEKLVHSREMFIRVKEEFSAGRMRILYGIGYIVHWVRYAKLAVDNGDGQGYTDVRPSGETDEDGFVYLDTGEHVVEPKATLLADEINLTGERPAHILPLDSRLQGRLRIRTKMPNLPRWEGSITDEHRALLDAGPGFIHASLAGPTPLMLFNPLLSDVKTHNFMGLSWTSNEYSVSAFAGPDREQVERTVAVVVYKGEDYRVQVAQDGGAPQEWSLWDFFPQAPEEDGHKRLYYSDGSPSPREAGDFWPQPERLNLLPNYDFAHEDFPFRHSCRVGPFRVRARSVADKLGVMFTAAAEDCPVSVWLESFYPQSESARVPE